MKSQRWLFAVLSLVVIVVTVACGATPTPTPTKPPAPAATPTTPPAPTPTIGPKRGGTFIDASFADGVSLQPLITSDSASSNYQALLWAPLTRIDPKTLDIVGVMYEPAPTFSADGSKMTWKLRQGLKWSDGKPITTADIIFTWQKMMDEKVKFVYRANYQDAFSDVKALDDYTVEYTLKTAGFCPAVASSGLVYPLPKHIYEGLDINQNDINNKPAVTSGVWKFKEWQKDDHFTAGPGYDGFVRGLAFMDGYTYRIVKDNTVQTALFKTQEVDVAYPDPADWDEITKLPFANPVPYYSATGAAWTYIGFNYKNPILADKVVRQAISTAVNKDEMIKTIRLGHAKPQYSMLPSSSWAAADEKDLPKFAFDPAKAKKMLDDAGYKLGADGKRLDKSGKPIKLGIFYNSGNKQREQIAIITQQYLKDIGIESTVEAVEWNAYLERVQKTRDMDMFVLGWTGGYDPNTTKNIWGTGRGQNYTGFANEEVDKLYVQAETVPGCKQADRKALYVKIQQIIAEEQPYLFLYTNENLYVYNKRVNTLPLTGVGVMYDLEKVSINPVATK